MIYMVNPVVLLTWLFASWIIGEFGRNKRLGFFGNFLVSLVFSPVVGLIVIWVSRERPRLLRKRGVAKSTTSMDNSARRA